ncbi:diguanylate cyclase [Desulfonema ishimotonii]|uniref:Thiamine pyrimidine synthase n=1 Tax=Desulfonema ishimotonii TaxID=45657 RepID=A0A401FVB6_9BACT|nr:ABC transporter substrate-binding protein [Desulfonema ishimotonii]GBC60905.1 diguanylate cyclase [Desulfonema ishimotonii]
MKLTKSLICLLIIASATAHANAGEPLQPLTLQPDWIINVNCAGILLAKDRGWYEDAGIDLTIKSWKAGISPSDEVVHGNAHIGLAEGALLISGFDIPGLARGF